LSIAVWQQCHYDVDLIIIGPEKPDPIRVDLKLLYELPDYVVNMCRPNNLTPNRSDCENKLSNSRDLKLHRPCSTGVTTDECERISAAVGKTFVPLTRTTYESPQNLEDHRREVCNGGHTCAPAIKRSDSNVFVFAPNIG
jgi:hypothetical protein